MTSDTSGWKKGFLGAGPPTPASSSSQQQQQPTADPSSQFLQQAKEAQSMYVGHRWAEAEVAYRRLLHQQDRVLGPSHPDTMQSMHMLGEALAQQDKYEEGEQLFRDVLQMRQRTLEIDHPSTLDTASCLAQILVPQGRHAEAEPMLRWIHRIHVRVLGANHLTTLMAQISLTTSLTCINRHTEALELLLDAWQRTQGSVGLQGLAGTARSELAGCYMELGDFASAEPLLREGLRQEENGCRGYQGKEMCDVMLLALGRCLSAKGDHAAAEPYFRKAVKHVRRLRGDKSYAAFAAMHEHAKCLIQAGRQAVGSGEHELAMRRTGEAVVMARIALELSQDVAGPHLEHARFVLSSALFSQCRCELFNGTREQWQSKLNEAESAARDYIRALDSSPETDDSELVSGLVLLYDILGDMGQPATGTERKQLWRRIKEVKRCQQREAAEAHPQP